MSDFSVSRTSVVTEREVQQPLLQAASLVDVDTCHARQVQMSIAPKSITDIIIKPHKDTSFLSRLVDAFNVKKNVSSMLWRSSETADQSTERLDCLDGVRALALLWVISVHVIGFHGMVDAVPDIIDEISLVGQWYMRPIANGDMGVDVFFVLSGFLIPYVLLKLYRPTTKDRMSGCSSIDQLSFYVQQTVTFFVRRFFRIWPALAAAVLIYFCVGAFLLDGEKMAFLRTVFYDNCKANWYSTLFFLTDFQALSINNQCIGWTWSITVEFHMYLISPLIVGIYVWRVNYGYWALIMWGTASLTGQLVLINESGWDTLPMQTTPDFLRLIYGQTWARLPPYLMGMWACFKYHDLRVHLKEKGITMADWSRLRAEYNMDNLLLLFSFLTFLSVFSIKSYDGWFPYPYQPLVLWGLTFTRPLVGLATAVVLYLCITGCQGVVTRFLSSKFLYPLAQLSYAAYLFQFLAMLSVHSFIPTSALGPVTFWRYVPLAALYMLASFLFAVPIHLLVEKPLMRLRW